MELLLCRLEQFEVIELLREQSRNLEQGGDIVDIAVDALGNPGILHLDRQKFAFAGQRAVDLADAGGGNRARLEPAETGAPVLAPFVRKHLVQLRAERIGEWAVGQGRLRSRCRIGSYGLGRWAIGRNGCWSLARDGTGCRNRCR